MKFNIGDRVAVVDGIVGLSAGTAGTIRDSGALYSTVKFDKNDGLYNMENKAIELIEDDKSPCAFDAKVSEPPKTNKYKRKVSGIPIPVSVGSSIVTIEIDIYDVLKAWNVTNPASQHAIKKLLQPGERGHKDKLTDLREAGKSIDRAIELES